MAFPANASGSTPSFKSDNGAILVLVEAIELTPHARAVSTPQKNRRRDVAKRGHAAHRIVGLEFPDLRLHLSEA